MPAVTSKCNMIKNRFIIMPSYADLADKCDYVRQTAQILGHENKVLIFAINNSVSVKGFWENISNLTGFLKNKGNGVFVWKITVLVPKQELRLTKISLIINIFTIKLIYFVFNSNQKALLWVMEPICSRFFLFFFNSESIYDCVDYYAGMGEAWKKEENYLIPRVKYFFVNSKTLLNLHQKQKTPPFLVSLGFDYSGYKDCKITSSRDRRPTVGYIGGINYRLDYKLLTSVIEGMPDVDFVFAGPIDYENTVKKNLSRDINRLFHYRNVIYRGNLEKSRLPDLISTFKVVIIPYDATLELNKYCYPMKIMEYFYMGKPVVSTSIFELSRYPEFVTVVKTPAEFIKAVNKAKVSPWPKSQITRQKKISLENSWKNKIMEISRFIAQRE